MVVDGELREVPAGAVAFDRVGARWVFDRAEAERRERRAPAALFWVPRDVVEVWEDDASTLTIHVEGAPIVYVVAEARSTFEVDAAALLRGDDEVIPGWWRAEHWNEHAERVAVPDGPRLVAIWDAGRVELQGAQDHPYGRPPGPAALRYLGRLS